MEKKEIKIVGLDLDGTLLTDKKELLPYTKKVIAEALKNGTVVLVATGRPWTGVPEELRELPGMDYALTANGARIIETGTGKVLEEHLLSKEAAKKAIAIGRKYDTLLEVYFDGQGYAQKDEIAQVRKYHKNPNMWDYFLRTRIAVDRLEDLLDEKEGNLDKVQMLFADMEEREEAWKELEREGVFELVGSLQYNIEINAVGVNKGTLGFLAEISPDNVKESLDKLINDDFNIESRMMLDGRIIRDGKQVYSSTVLNDIVIHRGGDLAITDYQVYVNKEILGNYHADGIILSTPTGSTAYNLSAGGPVARPDSNMIILTPICPHTLANRSLILSRHDNIEVKIGKSRIANEENRRISFDGDGIFKIISGDIISISESEKTTKIAKLDEGSFLQAVKDKLN